MSRCTGILQRTFGFESAGRVGFCGHDMDHGKVKGARGGQVKNHHSPPRKTEAAKSGVREGDQVSTTTPPTKTDRDIGSD